MNIIYANGDYTGIQCLHFPLYFKGLTAKRNVWLKCPNTRKIDRASVACHWNAGKRKTQGILKTSCITSGTGIILFTYIYSRHTVNGCEVVHQFLRKHPVLIPRSTADSRGLRKRASARQKRSPPPRPRFQLHECFSCVFFLNCAMKMMKMEGSSPIFWW